MIILYNGSNQINPNRLNQITRRGASPILSSNQCFPQNSVFGSRTNFGDNFLLFSRIKDISRQLRISSKLRLNVVCFILGGYPNMGTHYGGARRTPSAAIPARYRAR